MYCHWTVYRCICNTMPTEIIGFIRDSCVLFPGINIQKASADERVVSAFKWWGRGWGGGLGGGSWVGEQNSFPGRVSIIFAMIQSNPINYIMMIKTTQWGILFNQHPEEIKRRGSALVISDEVLVEQNTEQYFFLFFFHFYSVNYWILIFVENTTCFHIPFYFMLLTSYSLSWGVHLNCFIPRKSLCIQATTAAQFHVTSYSMTSQWVHVTKYIWNLLGWG